MMSVPEFLKLCEGNEMKDKTQKLRNIRDKFPESYTKAVTYTLIMKCSNCGCVNHKVFMYGEKWTDHRHELFCDNCGCLHTLDRYDAEEELNKCPTTTPFIPWIQPVEWGPYEITCTPNWSK
jgi:hypothetical protein